MTPEENKAILQGTMKFNEEIQSANMALGYKINAKKIRDLKDLIRADARLSQNSRRQVCALLAAAHTELDKKLAEVVPEDEQENETNDND